MCGVLAVLGKNYHFREALESISHRGIRSTVVENLIGRMGHVRLPIVGVGEDHDQPRVGRRWTIAFVGQVLDFRDSDPGAECDFELVVKMWEEGGPAEFCHHDGFWSVVAMDERLCEIHVLCDYLGQKPMYYREDLMAVASEPQAVAMLGPVTPDESYLAAVVKWGYCPDVRATPYQEVKRVLPGEHVVITTAGTTREIVDVVRPVAMPTWDLKEEIIEAVRRRAVSADVPVAALVSGGLDSAVTYTLASRYRDVHAYHVENGEGEAADEVIAGRPATFLALGDVNLCEALQWMQEPLDLGSLMPQLALAKAMHEAERVCLSGDGADELFGGYGRSMRYDSQASDVWHELVAWHLPRLDRIMMRERIEMRSPFLARRVLQGALALPWEMRRDKALLRDLFADDLPPGVAYRPKKALRTREVEGDREGRSRELVRMFRESVYG